MSVPDSGQLIKIAVILETTVLSVHVLSHSETVNISDRAIDEIPSQIVEAQTWDVDAVSSATFMRKGSGRGIISRQPYAR